MDKRLWATENVTKLHSATLLLARSLESGYRPPDCIEILLSGIDINICPPASDDECEKSRQETDNEDSMETHSSVRHARFLYEVNRSAEPGGLILCQALRPRSQTTLCFMFMCASIAAVFFAEKKWKDGHIRQDFFSVHNVESKDR